MLAPVIQPLAAVIYERGQDIDALFIDVSAKLRTQGVRVGGLIQQSTRSSEACAAGINVVDLQTGQTFDIWQKRGRDARGCRLDERGLLVAEPAILSAVGSGVDLIVINRFGRAESLGRGLLGCFQAALEAEIPILTAVRAPYCEGWEAFHGGLGGTLEPNVSHVMSWLLAAAPLRHAYW